MECAKSMTKNTKQLIKSMECLNNQFNILTVKKLTFKHFLIPQLKKHTHEKNTIWFILHTAKLRKKSLKPRWLLNVFFVVRHNKVNSVVWNL